MQGFDEVLRVGRLMQGFDRPWGFCGGWAIDLFLGRATRRHGDVDVAVLRHDQAAIQEYLTDRGWFLEIAHEGMLTVWTQGMVLDASRDTVWASNQGYDPAFVELLFNESDGEHLLLPGKPGLTLRLREAFVQTAAGVPVVAPEVVLLYEAERPEGGDLEAVLPALGSRREWLAAALGRTYPQHPWLARLASGPTTPPPSP